MSGEMIAIVAVGVALAGVILTSLRGTEARLGAQVDCADWNSKEYSGRRWLRI